MSRIYLKTYGNVISDEMIGDEILSKVKSVLNDEGVVEVDFSEVITMATFCARQVFGKLYVDLGREAFIKKVLLFNANDTIKAIVSDAIEFSVKQSGRV